jgi:hypothetical protein
LGGRSANEVQAIVWIVVVVLLLLLLLLLRSSFVEVRTVVFAHLPSGFVRFGSRLVEQ